MTTKQIVQTMVLAQVGVTAVQRLSPSFVRVELGGPELADFGVDGPLYDQRFKLIFPGASGELPSFESADESWFSTWMDRPAEERGHMRTYTIRKVVGEGSATRVVVDLVLHPGATGPGSSWAENAEVGTQVVLLAPRRGVDFGGIEFAPGPATEVLLAGDETAVPALSSIVECWPDGVRGTVFFEVPLAEDVLDLDAPPGVELVWLPRGGADLGSRLTAAIAERLGARPSLAAIVTEDEVDPDLWETPAYSSSGESVDVSNPIALDGLYAWIAGESKVVTGLRRMLVGELGMPRQQVAFMGYWRRGVAMRS